MIQSRSGPGFAAKPLQRLRVVGDIVGQKLQGDEAAEHDVLSLVHHTHAPAAQLFQDAIVRNGLTDHWGPLWSDVRRSRKASQSGAGYGYIESESRDTPPR